jgi:hypothetical protein
MHHSGAGADHKLSAGNHSVAQGEWGAEGGVRAFDPGLPRCE